MGTPERVAPGIEGATGQGPRGQRGDGQRRQAEGRCAWAEPAASSTRAKEDRGGDGETRRPQLKQVSGWESKCSRCELRACRRAAKTFKGRGGSKMRRPAETRIAPARGGLRGHARRRYIRGHVSRCADPTRRHGFTLIELCIVLALAVLLMAVAMPSLSGQLARQRNCNRRSTGSTPSWPRRANTVSPKAGRTCSSGKKAAFSLYPADLVGRKTAASSGATAFADFSGAERCEALHDHCVRPSSLTAQAAPGMDLLVVPATANRSP